jgi:hypothetical protein
MRLDPATLSISDDRRHLAKCRQDKGQPALTQRRRGAQIRRLHALQLALLFGRVSAEDLSPKDLS